MAKQKKAKKKRKTKKQIEQQEQLMIVLLGIGFIFLSIFSLLRLGFLGNVIANGLRIVSGNAYPVLSVTIIVYGVVLIFQNTKFQVERPRRLVGAAVFYLGILLLLHLQLFAKVQDIYPNIIGTTWDLLRQDVVHNEIRQNVGGGMVGALLYAGSYFLVSRLGSYFIAIALLLLGIYLFALIEAHQVISLLQKFSNKLQGVVEANEGRRERKQEQAQQAQNEQPQVAAAKQDPAVVAEKATPEPAAGPSWLERLKAKKAQRAQLKAQEQAEQLAQQQADLAQEEAAAEEGSAVAEVVEQRPVAKPEVQIERFDAQGELSEMDRAASLVAERINVKENAQALAVAANNEVKDDGSDLEFEITAEAEDRDYELPPSTLLDSIQAADQSDEYQKIEENISVLERTFASFGVDAKVVKASLGPSVTKFEIQPAIGVKVSKIVSLTDDIALALAAKDVRMEAPIPGKSLIGIEVPNQTISTVSFRDIIEAQPQHPDKLLEVPLGRDISGMVQMADLAKMPHLLIAGSTGSGKSVAINGIITSILMRAKPHEVKMMMIDPKMVELNVYNGIPHLLTPVVTNPRKAAQALQKVVQEMEERYEKFAATGVRNITGYNELIAQRNMEKGEGHPTLPFIVVIVDELADLMMVASNEVEDAIIRLAQMARAAGIHMILATQRPSVDVITGIIKANVPSRIAFAVSSGTDSRTIIDSNGAEKLLGRGDMLFLPMGENKPIRVQGAFISDQEVERIVAFVTDQQQAEYQEKMMPTDEVEVSSNPQDHPQDELFEEAKALVVEMQTASISLLQRRFRIGYNRAARLVDELEAQGVIGPSVGSKPREVYLQEIADLSAEAGEEPVDEQ